MLRARSMARTTARALLRHSSYSLSGTESATMPAPAWMWPCLPCMTEGADGDAGVEIAGEVGVEDARRRRCRGGRVRALR